VPRESGIQLCKPFPFNVVDCDVKRMTLEVHGARYGGHNPKHRSKGCGAPQCIQQTTIRAESSFACEQMLCLNSSSRYANVIRALHLHLNGTKQLDETSKSRRKFPAVRHCNPPSSREIAKSTRIDTVFLPQQRKFNRCRHYNDQILRLQGRRPDDLTFVRNVTDIRRLGCK
jgi:hypothetical protein